MSKTALEAEYLSVIEWLMSDDVGESSKAICAKMSGVGSQNRSYPHDPSDLGRCLRLLARFPHWRERLPEMATLSPAWGGLVSQWDEIATTFEREKAVPNSKYAPETYDLMEKAIAKGYLSDPRYSVKLNKNGHVISCFLINATCEDDDESFDNLSLRG